MLKLDHGNYTQAYIGAVTHTALNTESHTNLLFCFDNVQNSA